MDRHSGIRPAFPIIVVDFKRTPHDIELKTVPLVSTHRGSNAPASGTSIMMMMMMMTMNETAD